MSLVVVSFVVVSLVVVVVVVIVTRCYYANIELLNCMVHASFNRIVASLYKAREERQRVRERHDSHCCCSSCCCCRIIMAIYVA